MGLPPFWFGKYDRSRQSMAPKIQQNRCSAALRVAQYIAMPENKSKYKCEMLLFYIKYN